jgi:hypothetical protein
LIRDLGPAAQIAREATAAANPRLKTEDRLVSAQKYKSSLNGDFNEICNKTCGLFDRFDYPLRFKYRAIPANAE